MNLTVLQLQGTRVRQLGDAMASALSQLRTQGLVYAAEGRITPEEVTSLHSMATTALNTACNCDSSNFEPSLLGFYRKWEDSEIVELTRKVEILQNVRSQELLILELNDLQSQLEVAKQSKAHLALLPVLALRGLPAQFVSLQLNQMIDYYTHNLYPVAKLRYPQTFVKLAATTTGSEDLLKLENATWSDSFLDWADRADRAALAVSTQFDSASPPTGVGFARVVMRYPRDLSKPNPLDPTKPANHVDEGSSAYLFPYADAFMSTATWNEVMTGDGLAHLTVRAEDIYNARGGSARLDCHQTAPAIRSMVLVGVLPNSVTNGGSYTGGIWNVPLDVEPNVLYPTLSGPQNYVLDPSLTHYLPRVYFIKESSIDADLNALQAAMANAAAMEVAGGISPFSSFSFDLGAFRQQFKPPATLKDPLLVIGEWMLVFDLETKNAPTPMSWLGPCVSAR